MADDTQIEGGLFATNSPVDAIGFYGDLVSASDALPAWEYLTGQLPYCVEGIEPLGEVLAGEIERATGLALVRQTKDHTSGNWAAAFMGEGGAVAVNHRAGKTTCCAYGASEEEAGKLAIELAGLGAVDEADEVERYYCSFVYRGERRVVRTVQEIKAPAWDEIAINYEARAREALGRLMAVERPSSGRLVMLHGPTGTGKTTVVRSLVRAWSSWCDTAYILDPSELFSRNDYLNELVVGEQRSGRWQLFVIEDADEVIAGDANANKHLSRLLNLTDGFLGSELKVAFLITTNERLGRLSPALSRPGRCLAEVEIGALRGEAVRSWLVANGAGVGGGETATLAELYERVGEGRRISGPQASGGGTGQYL